MWQAKDRGDGVSKCGEVECAWRRDGKKVIEVIE
jgi:hypothetical protein